MNNQVYHISNSNTYVLMLYVSYSGAEMILLVLTEIRAEQETQRNFDKPESFVM